MAELDGLEDDLTAQVEAGETPAYLLPEPELPSAPTAQVEGAEQVDEFGLPVRT
jgi:hypothetical protein